MGLMRFLQNAGASGKNRYWQIAVTVLLVLTLLTFVFAFQGSRGLWERDEGRYTNIAVRMLRTGDFIVPAFNDDVPHFAKPPLTYWAIAGGIALLGWNEWGARLPNALAFILTVIIVFALAKRITPDRPWLPPVIYATSLLPFSAANIVTTDTLLTLWEAIAVLGFVWWWQQKERPKKFGPLFVMWTGFGLAFLTKGPPGLLPLLAIIVFVLLAQGWRVVFRLVSISGVVTFMVVGLGWYLLVAVTHPGLMTYFVQEEFVHRIASGTYHRNPQWYHAFSVYMPVLIIGTLPWTFPLFRAARSIPQTLFSRTWWKRKLETDQWPVFYVLWVILPLAVFFVSKSRLPLYLLPLFVPLALITGRLVRFRPERNVSIYLLAIWIVVLIALKFAGSLYPYAKDSCAMARAIENTVHPIPSEIAFVDSEPFWGLSLYLQCEVERVASSSKTSSGTSPDDTLAAELKKGEPRTLLMIEGSKEARVMEVCRQSGFPARKLAQIGSWALIAPTNELSKTHEIQSK
jgi:4-amino-4-deoxy-L-arabinose transferase